MKKLISLAILVGLAVLLTLAAIENTGKVAIFLSTHRIDFSLNFGIVALVLCILTVWFLLGVIRASGEVPSRLKKYLGVRRQQALLKANTTGLMALVIGDDMLADKALRNARKTGEHNELSYLIRAMSAIQSDRLDVAEAVLAEKTTWDDQYQDALVILKAQIALKQNNYRLALEHVQSLPNKCSRYPQVQKTKLFAQLGLQQWALALAQLRHLSGSQTLSVAELNAAFDSVYTGLVTESIQKDSESVMTLVNQASSSEKSNPFVLKHLTSALLSIDQPDQARRLLEQAMEHELNDVLLDAYAKVATVISQSCLPFVERLLTKHPDHIDLIMIAAEVCEKEQLWGKSIARFERVYQQQPSATIASKLKRLYDLANQPEKAAHWQAKLQNHLNQSRRLS